MSRRSADDRRFKDYPHVYTGPTSKFRARNGAELWNGERCRIVGRRAGGLRIRTAKGGEWIVGKKQVAKAAP